MITTLDIIIPVYRPDESFEKALGMLSAQTCPYNRLIIIHTISGDEADERVGTVLNDCVDQKRLIVRDISKDEFDHASARRLGVSLSDADAFLCMTDDAVPADKYFLERLKEALDRDQRIAVAYARQLPREDASPAERFSRGYNYPAKSMIKGKKDLESLGIKTYFASNVAAAYSRAHYDELGGFPEFAVFNEDMIYAARAVDAGFMIYYKADAMVVHSHDTGAVAAMRRNFDNGMSQSMNPEIFDRVSSETEGMKYLKSGVKYLSSSDHKKEIPGFILSSGLRLIGFKLGKNFKRLPRGIVKRLSSDPAMAGRALMEERS